MMMIRALVFDAYGTLFDTQSVVARVEQACPGKGELISQLWRLKQLEYTWLRGLLQEYEDFWEVTRAALDFALRAAGVEPSDAIRAPLMENSGTRGWTGGSRPRSASTRSGHTNRTNTVMRWSSRRSELRRRKCCSFPKQLRRRRR